MKFVTRKLNHNVLPRTTNVVVKAVIMGRKKPGSALVSMFNLDTHTNTLWLYEADQLYHTTRNHIEDYFGIPVEYVTAFLKNIRQVPLPHLPTLSVEPLQHGNQMYVMRDPPPPPPMAPQPTMHAPPPPMAMAFPSPVPTDPGARFDYLCVRYASMLYHAAPALVQAYQSSTKQDTDDFATRIIVQAGYNLHEVEDDAMWIVQHACNTSIENLPVQFCKSFRQIIKTLREPNSPSNSKMLLDIKNAKEAYTDWILKNCNERCCLSVPCALEPLRMCCCLFFCCVSVCIWNAPNTLWCQPGVVIQNSLWYCTQHYGLSLINARRHQCRLCFLFNVVMIRNTPSDQTHIDMIDKHLHVPLWGSSGPNSRYTVQRYCANDLMKRINEGHVIRSSYDEFGDMSDGRPANSVVYTDETDNSTIVGWVHMLQLMQNG